MSAISGGDATIIRTNSAVKDMYLNIFPATTTYGEADVTSSPTYPIDEIAITSLTGTWSANGDMFVRILDSTETVVKYEGTVRKVSTTVLYVSRMQDGDTGTAQEYGQSIIAGDKVKVYAVYVPRSFLSFLDGSGIFYKRSDLEYDATYADFDRQTRYGFPQPNMGAHVHEVIDPIAGTATFTMSASASTDFEAGALSYLWTLPSGVSFVAPSVNTDATVTLEADPGHYVIRCRVTNGTTTFFRNGKRHVWITDNDTVKTFNEQFAVTAIENDTQDRDGRSLSFTVEATRGTDLSAYLYAGAPTMLTYGHDFTGDQWEAIDAVTAGVLVEKFYGYIRKYEQIKTEAESVDTYRVFVESPLKYFATLPIATQSLVAKTTPTEWNEIYTGLSHIAYVTKYLLDFHAPMLTELHDFDYADLTSFSKKFWETKGGDLYTALKSIVSQCVGASIGCKSDGSMLIRRNGAFESDAWRSANVTQWTWTDSDIVEELSYDRDPIMQFGQTRGAGFVTGTSANPTAVSAIASVLAQSQGIGQAEMTGFIGASSDDIRDRVGHYHQFINTPTKAVSFETREGHDFIEPALMEWHAMAVTGYDPLDTGILEGNYKTLPLSVTRFWEFGDTGISKRLTVTLVPETKGKRAPLEPTTVRGVTFNPTWCYTWDFTVDNGDWTAYNGTGATYSAGVGWNSADLSIFGFNQRIVAINKSFSSRVLTSVSFTYNLTKGTYDSAGYGALQIFVEGFATIANIANPSVSSGTGVVYTASGLSQNATNLFFSIASSIRTTASYSGSCRITSITVQGLGSNPFGSSNC